MSASAEAPFHGTENSRPSTATVSPPRVMIDSGCAPVLSASASAPRSTNKEFNPPAASSAVEIVVAGRFEEMAIGVEQRIVPVNQHADRKTVEQRWIDAGGRRHYGGAGRFGRCGTFGVIPR